MSVKYINEVTLIGYAGRDAEVRNTTGGKAVVSLNLATTRNWKGNNGEWENETTWHYVTVFGYVAEKAKLVAKGMPVMVRGRISNEKWTDKTGAERNTTKIIAYSVELLVNDKTLAGYSGSGPAQPAQPKQTMKDREVQNVDDFDDDIPF